jgi:hypothetical protein
MLATSASRAIGIYLDVFRADGDLNGVLDVGQDFDFGERSVTAMCGIEA